MDVSRRDLIKLGTTATAAAAGGLLTAQTGQAQTPTSGGQTMRVTPLGVYPARPRGAPLARPGGPGAHAAGGSPDDAADPPGFQPRRSRPQVRSRHRQRG